MQICACCTQKHMWHAFQIDRRPTSAVGSSARALQFPAMHEGSPQLRLSLVVSTQKGLAMVPHCVVPPVHEKMHVPMLQMVIAAGSVGHTLPHLPLRTTTGRQHAETLAAFSS